MESGKLSKEQVPLLLHWFLPPFWLGAKTIVMIKSCDQVYHWKMPDKFLWCSLYRYEVDSELPLRFRPGGHISPVYHCPQLPRTKDNRERSEYTKRRGGR